MGKAKISKCLIFSNILVFYRVSITFFDLWMPILIISLFHAFVNKRRTVKLVMKHSMLTYLRHIFSRGLQSSGHERFPLAPWQQPPPFTRFWGFFTSSTWMKNVIFALVLFWRRQYFINEMSISITKKNRNIIFQELAILITLTHIKNVVN